MTERANAFANLEKPPVFEPRPRKEKPVLEAPKSEIEQIAEKHNFPSRQARRPPAAPKRVPRTYRTGRNCHFAVKASSQTIDRFHRAADRRGVTLARLLELALDALDEQGEAAGPSDQRLPS